MGSSKVMIQAKDLENQERRALVFPLRKFGREKEQGLVPFPFPHTPLPPIPPGSSSSSFPPTGDSPLQAFIASAMGAEGRRGGGGEGEAGRGNFMRGVGGLHFGGKEAAEAHSPLPENGPIRMHYCPVLCHPS